MRSSPILACTALAGLLALGACSGKGGDNAAAIANDTSPAAAAARMPKAGLWKMTVASAAMPKPMTMDTCIGEPTPGANPFAPPTPAGQTCSKNKIVPTATGYTIDVECTGNGMGMAVNGEVSGDFTSSYKTELTTKMTGANLPPAAQQAMKSTIDAKYVGACPADLKPGQTKQAS